MGNAASSSGLSSTLQSVTLKPLDGTDDVDSASFWDSLLPSSPVPFATYEKVVTLQNVRDIIKNHPRNIVLILMKCIHILNTSFESSTHPRLLNAIRLLTRIMPVIMELGEYSSFVENVLWRGLIPSETTEQSKDVIVWEQCSGTSVAEALITGVMSCLFRQNFTVHEAQVTSFKEKLASTQKKEPKEDRPNLSNAVWPALLWQAGIGFSKYRFAAATNSMVGNRTDVLKLLLICLTYPMYREEGSLNESRIAGYITSGTCPYAPTLFYSLFNTIMAYDPIGYGIPFASVMYGSTTEENVAVSLQVLLALLDFRPISLRATPPDAASANEPTSANESSTVSEVLPSYTSDQSNNMYISLLAGLEDAHDLEMIANQLSRLILLSYTTDIAMLPPAWPSVVCLNELLLLLWNVLSENPHFLTTFLASEKLPEVVFCLIHHLLLHRNSEGSSGILYICTFLLLLLSGEREFGVSLNKTVTQRPTEDMDLPADASYNDLIVLGLHKCIVDSSERLNPLFSCFITIICNISPYMKRMNLYTARRFLNIIELFSSPRFLFARERNYIYVQQLLEALSNILQYQYSSNNTLVLALVRRRGVIAGLQSLSVSKWFAMLHAKRTTADKEKPAPRRQPPTASKGAAAVADEGEGVGLVGTGEDAADAAAAAAFAARTQVIGDQDASSSAVEDSSAEAEKTFVPTDEWLVRVKAELPLDTPVRLLDWISARLLQHFKADSLESIKASDDVLLDFIEGECVVGVLPVPHPLLMRRYQPNHFSSLWLRTFLFSTIYVHQPHLFDSNTIKLFSVTKGDE